MRTVVIFVAFFVSCWSSASLVYADDFDMAIKEWPEHMTSAFRSFNDKTKITLIKCLDGDGSKTRTVCNYKLDDYMVAMASGEAGSTQLGEVTLICTASDEAGSARCLTAYGAGFATVVPDMPKDDRGKIVHYLFEGIQVGDAAQLTKDGHRYILQKVVGSLWFHLEASE